MIISLDTKNPNVLDKIPHLPGCYIFRSNKGAILYVGKAIDLHRRIKQYFNFSGQKISPSSKIEPKKQVMISKAYSVECITTDSEVEALILETNLIKKYKPPYNRLMVDDKNYGWVMITTYEDFPRIKYVRAKEDKKAEYFGPFPSTFPARKTLKKLRYLYPYRTCNRSMKEVSGRKGLRVISSNPKPCLYYHLSLCNAPCADLERKSEYRKHINSIKRYFRGEKRELIDSLKKDMRNYADHLEFEKAALIRDQIDNLQYIMQKINLDEEIDEEKWKIFKEKRRVEGLKNLQLNLANRNIIDGKNTLERIECFDISNISGKFAVGSMVVFKNGIKSKSDYRKFKIKFKDTPDDFEMMREIFRRRFKQKKNTKELSFSSSPNLIIVDGGKGQLSAVIDVFKELGVQVSVVGLAKREETIIWYEDGRFQSYKLKNGSQEKFLVQRIRDEAHRFAISYHRKLRRNYQKKSKLDTIPGIGPVTKKKLLKEFKSVDGIQRASKKQLGEVVRNRRTVENILKFL